MTFPTTAQSDELFPYSTIDPAQWDESDADDRIADNAPVPTRPKWRMLAAAVMLWAFVGTCMLMVRKRNIPARTRPESTIKSALVKSTSLDVIQQDDEHYDFEWHNYFKTKDGHQDECHDYLDKSIVSVTLEHECSCYDIFQKGFQQCKIPHTWALLRLDDGSGAIVELFPEHFGFGTNEVFCKISKENNWGDHNGLQDVSGKTLRDIYDWGKKRLIDHPTYTLWKGDMTEWHDDPDLSGKLVDDKDSENCISFAWALVYSVTKKTCTSYGCACGWQRQNMCCVEDNKWYNVFTACRQSAGSEICSGSLSRR